MGTASTVGREGQHNASLGRRVPGQPSGAGSAPAPDPNGSTQEAATRLEVDESERLRTMQSDAQTAATEKAAEAMADEKRLTAAQSAALERLKQADAAVKQATQHLADLNQRRTEAQNRINGLVAALGSVVPVILRMSTYPVETLLASQAPAEEFVRGVLVMRTVAHQAEIDAQSLIADRVALDAATKAAAEVDAATGRRQSCSFKGSGCAGSAIGGRHRTP